MPGIFLRTFLGNSVNQAFVYKLRGLSTYDLENVFCHSAVDSFQWCLMFQLIDTVN